MTEATAGRPSSSRRPGPPPAIAPELVTALGAPQQPITAAALPSLRIAQPSPTDAELARGGAFLIREIAVPGPEAAPAVQLILCLPAGRKPTGCIYFIHGGGMMLGTPRNGLAEILEYAEASGLLVASVDYRLAPETRHPGPVQDCYAGLVWVAAHCTQLGFPPGRLIVAGTSAGGGLGAAAVLMARDRGGPSIAAQMLLAPMLDHRNDTRSMLQLQGAGTWNRETNQLGWNSLLGPDIDRARVSPYASPSQAKDLAGLPPSYIDVGAADAFLDEDVDYALRIIRAGGLAELHVWPGAYHGFEGLAPDSAITRDAKLARAAFVRRAADNT
ncbi:esterase [Sinomonas atrocyanea]|uniref:Esterase n=1 Tax=Sinomonas atrocyanea TaxID=37927 RepID=A0A126ZX36_9MICC|nr:alpha/beta hydrolase [Sinomonas atrocyanea]AMM31663.1 esterase [Sinomonas atrocyanea]GEB65350.1 esterase [Sinomonas atrocyanea]GGG58992.1 esterase [Sinomonas atrocyanea]